MDKEQISEQLKSIRDKKEKAIEEQNYELASEFRDRERELLKQLEETEQREEKNSL